MNARRIYEQARVKRNLRQRAATPPAQPPAQPPAAPVEGANALDAAQVVDALRALNRKVEAAEQKVLDFDKRLATIEAVLAEVHQAKPPATRQPKLTRLVMPHEARRAAKGR